MSTFVEDRAEFFARMQGFGMPRDSAGYCISIAKRLRGIYSDGKDVAALEHATLAALRNALARLAVETEWACVPGGLFEGDTAVLYIVPPGGDPVAVPLPPSETAVSTVTPHGAQVEELTQQAMQQAMQEAMQAQNWWTQQQVMQDWYGDGLDTRTVRMRRRIDAAADRERWGESIRNSPEYQRLCDAAVELELLRERGDQRAAMFHAEAKALYDSLRLRHAMAHMDVQSIGPETVGYRQLQEAEEKRKRRANRYRK